MSRNKTLAALCFGVAGIWTSYIAGAALVTSYEKIANEDVKRGEAVQPAPSLPTAQFQ